MLSNWLAALMHKCCKVKGRRQQDEAKSFMVIPDQAIAIVIGMLTALLIQNPPFMVKKAKWAQNFLKDEPHELLLGLQLMVLPPIVFEATVNVVKRGRVITRLGTLIVSQVLLTFLTVPVLSILCLFFKIDGLTSSLILIFTLIIQLNDYSGSLDPHV